MRVATSLLQARARTVVEWVVFAARAVYALWIAIVSWAWGEFIAAGVGGVAAVLLLTRGQNMLGRTSRVVRQNASPSTAANKLMFGVECSMFDLASGTPA